MSLLQQQRGNPGEQFFMACDALVLGSEVLCPLARPIEFAVAGERSGIVFRDLVSLPEVDDDRRDGQIDQAPGGSGLACKTIDMMSVDVLGP
jgi:hypothetical protein